MRRPARAPARPGRHAGRGSFVLRRRSRCRDIEISIHNEREWADFCRDVLNEPGMISDPHRMASMLSRRMQAWGPWMKVLGSLQ